MIQARRGEHAHLEPRFVHLRGSREAHDLEEVRRHLYHREGMSAAARVNRREAKVVQAREDLRG